MKNKYKLVAALCAAFLMTPGYAQELVIYVYADRTPSYFANSTYSYEIIETDELDEVSSVDILSSGPKGQMSSLYIRGADSDQSLITLNGISIKDQSSPTGTDDIGQHNFTGISNIEIYKGPMSSLYGANAAGGVINLVSDITSRSYVSSTAGSNNLLTGEAQLSGQMSSNLNYTFSIESFQTDGISVYPNGAEKDPHDYNNVNLNLVHSDDYGNIRFNYINETNYSALDSTEDTLNYTGEWNWQNVQVDYSNDKSRLAYNNSKHNRVYTKDFKLEGKYDSTVDTFYGSHILNYNKSDVIVGTEIEKVNADFLINIDGAFPYTSSVDKKRTTKGIFVNANTVLGDSVLAYGIRHDSIDGFGEKSTGRLGVFNNGIRASISTGYRIPTLYEMYGQDNFGFNGNPNLLEEDTISYEIGYENNFLDTAFFITQEQNAIIYNGTYINDNNTSYTKGIENTLNYEIGQFFIENNIAIIDAKMSNGNQKLRRPKVTNNLKVAKVIDDIVYSFDVDYYGKHKDINSKTFEKIDVTPVVTYNTELNYEKNNLEVFAGIYNISNKQYERPNGFSQLGRNFKVGFKKYF